MTQKFYVDGTGKYLGSWDSGSGQLHPGVPIGAIEVASPPGDGRQTWKNNAWQAAVVTADDIDAYRDSRLAAGFADTSSGMTGKTWQCDDYSQGKWTAIGASAIAATVAQTSPAPTFTLIASDNSTVALSTTDALALINGRIMPWVSATMLYARTLKNNIAAGNPPADVTQGWP